MGIRQALFIYTALEAYLFVYLFMNYFSFFAFAAVNAVVDVDVVSITVENAASKARDLQPKYQKYHILCCVPQPDVSEHLLFLMMAVSAFGLLRTRVTSGKRAIK